MKQTTSMCSPLHGQVTEFAKKYIQPNRDDLINSPDFPTQVWKEAGKLGLLGLAVSEEYGGNGASYAEIAEFGYLLNKHGGVPGFTMSFTTHWLFPKLHLGRLASETQKNDLLPKIAKGEASLSVAISEPKIGAHPKHLKSALVEKDGFYWLSGEKTFLTNGPLASHFLTLVVSGEKDGRKEFSAVLLPADTEGVKKTGGVKLDFLHPCPHGGIEFENARVPTSELIGTRGSAFQEISHPTRVIEDAIGAYGLIGSLHSLFAEIARSNLTEKIDLFGSALSKLDALLPIAQQLSDNAKPDNPNAEVLSHMYLGFRSFIAQIMDELAIIKEANQLQLSHYGSLLERDITKILGIAKSAHTARLIKKGTAYIQARVP